MSQFGYKDAVVVSIKRLPKDKVQVSTALSLSTVISFLRT